MAENEICPQVSGTQLVAVVQILPLSGHSNSVMKINIAHNKSFLPLD